MTLFAAGFDRVDLTRVDAIIFDLGAVLLELDYEATIRGLSRLAGCEMASVYSRRVQAEVFDRFERGEISASEFRRELKRHYGLDATDDEIDAAWSALLRRVSPEHVALLHRLRRTHRLFLLSNTNEIHLRAFLSDFHRDHGGAGEDWGKLFEHAFYSHEIRMRKPEARIYQHVLSVAGVPAERALFIDDNRDNVDAASALGLQTRLIDPTRGGTEQTLALFDI